MAKRDSILRAEVQEYARLLCQCAASLGLSYAEVSKLLRTELVVAGHERLGGNANCKVTFSDVSAWIGVPRQQVSKILEGASKPNVVLGPASNKAARIVQGWMEDRDYRSRSGSPKVLNFRGDSGFSDLVRRYGRDITPKSAFRALERLGYARKTQGRVTLQPNALTATRRTKYLVENTVTSKVSLIRALGRTYPLTGAPTDLFVDKVTVTGVGRRLAPLFQIRAEKAVRNTLDKVAGLDRSLPKIRSKHPDSEQESQFLVFSGVLRRDDRPIKGGGAAQSVKKSSLSRHRKI